MQSWAKQPQAVPGPLVPESTLGNDSLDLLKGGDRRVQHEALVKACTHHATRQRCSPHWDSQASRAVNSNAFCHTHSSHTYTHTLALPCLPCGVSQGGCSQATIVERVLAVSWLVLPIGLVVSTAVCGFVLWQSPSADAAYRQAVVAHGGWAELGAWSTSHMPLCGVVWQCDAVHAAKHHFLPGTTTMRAGHRNCQLWGY